MTLNYKDVLTALERGEVTQTELAAQAKTVTQPTISRFIKRPEKIEAGNMFALIGALQKIRAKAARKSARKSRKPAPAQKAASRG